MNVYTEFFDANSKKFSRFMQKLKALNFTWSTGDAPTDCPWVGGETIRIFLNLEHKSIAYCSATKCDVCPNSCLADETYMPSNVIVNVLRRNHE